MGISGTAWRPCRLYLFWPFSPFLFLYPFFSLYHMNRALSGFFQKRRILRGFSHTHHDTFRDLQNYTNCNISSFAPENSQKVFLFLFNIQQSLFHGACVKLFIFRLSTFFKQTGLTFPQPTNPVFKRPRATFPQFSHPLLLRLPETMLFEDQKRIFIARKEQPHEHCLRQSTSVQCH